MYDMMGLEGLGEDLMISGKEAAAIGGSALLGAAVAKQVVEFSADLGLKKEKQADGTVLIKDKDGKILSSAEEKDKARMLPAWVPPLLPIAVGVAVHNYGKSRFPLAAPGVAAGMVAFGVGKLLVAVLPKKKGAETEDKIGDTVGKFLPLAGIGADVYDYSLQGFGIGPGDVRAYMMAGSPFTATPAMGTSIMSPGAPVQIQQFAGLGAGAPTQAQVISTTPSMSASLVG